MFFEKRSWNMVLYDTKTGSFIFVKRVEGRLILAIATTEDRGSIVVKTVMDVTENKIRNRMLSSKWVCICGCGS